MVAIIVAVVGVVALVVMIIPVYLLMRTPDKRNNPIFNTKLRLRVIREQNKRLGIGWHRDNQSSSKPSKH
jgi:hypothetical protein